MLTNLRRGAADDRHKAFVFGYGRGGMKHREAQRFCFRKTQIPMPMHQNKEQSQWVFVFAFLSFCPFLFFASTDFAADRHRGRLLRGLQHGGHRDEELVHAPPHQATEEVWSPYSQLPPVTTAVDACGYRSQNYPLFHNFLPYRRNVVRSYPRVFPALSPPLPMSTTNVLTNVPEISPLTSSAASKTNELSGEPSKKFLQVLQG